jgi:hypothetical protein
MRCFIFWLTQVSVAFLSNFISFGILMVTFFRICFKILTETSFFNFKVFFKNSIIHHLAYFVGSCSRGTNLAFWLDTLNLRYNINLVPRNILPTPRMLTRKKLSCFSVKIFRNAITIFCKLIRCRHFETVDLTSLGMLSHFWIFDTKTWHVTFFLHKRKHPWFW